MDRGFVEGQLDGWLAENLQRIGKFSPLERKAIDYDKEEVFVLRLDVGNDQVFGRLVVWLRGASQYEQSFADVEVLEVETGDVRFSEYFREFNVQLLDRWLEALELVGGSP